MESKTMATYEYRIYCPNCKKTSIVRESPLKNALFPVKCPICGYAFTRIDGYKKILPI